MEINDPEIFRERLPKHVFNGTRLRRHSIVVSQCIARLMAISFIIVSMYLFFIHKPDENANMSAIYAGIVLTLIGCIILVNKSERLYQFLLDGSSPLLIFENRISIPPRVRRKIIGKPDFLLKSEIESIRVIRGNGPQWINHKEGVHWKGIPMEIVIVTKKGKKYRSGPKPPNTIKQVLNVIQQRWGIRIEDPGNGMGVGIVFRGQMIFGELSYEDIMKMNLFEWQD